MKIETLFGSAIDMGLPLVLWRLPGDDKTRVTIESDPLKEWEEIQAKSGTLLRVLEDQSKN